MNLREETNPYQAPSEIGSSQVAGKRLVKFLSSVLIGSPFLISIYFWVKVIRIASRDRWNNISPESAEAYVHNVWLAIVFSLLGFTVVIVTMSLRKKDMRNKDKRDGEEKGKKKVSGANGINKL